MNWSDYTVLAIIIGFGIAGFIRGFVFSVFKIASFFIAIILSYKLYPKASEFISKTPIYDNIKKSIIKSLTNSYEAALPASGQDKSNAIDAMIGKLALPGGLKQSITEKIPDPSKVIDVQSILNNLGNEITKIIIGIISLVLLFIAIRICLYIIGFLLKGITKLPVIKQIDRLGGLAFGTAEGILMIYILFAVLTLFNSSSQFRQVFSTIDTSTVAKFFYQNNILIKWMFPQ